MTFAVLLVAFVATGAAQAHHGDRWFATKANTQKNITTKYRASVARCAVAPASGRYLAHAYDPDGFGAASYDHFICALMSEKTNRLCTVYVHITGQHWYDIVLTTIVLPNVTGCMPRDLGTRPGYRNN